MVLEWCWDVLEHTDPLLLWLLLRSLDLLRRLLLVNWLGEYD
jgi:hypothetical protein